MAQVEESVTSSFASDEPQDDCKPLWRFINVLEVLEDGGGNKVWRCNFCQKNITSSYSRVRYYLLKFSGKGVCVCNKVSDVCLADLNRICKEAANRLKPKHVPLPPPSQIPPGVPQKRKKGSIENSFNMDDRNTLRAMIARMFYSGGLSFNLARNPYCVSPFTFAAAADGSLKGFIPPSYNALRTTLLKQERANIERLLQPIKSLWPLKGVTLVSDGWTNVQRRPLINFMAISEGRPIFFKVVNDSKEYNDKHYMASIIKVAIKEVRPQNVVKIITENALVCKAAGMLIEVEFNHIFWTPCVVHTLNLALKNICVAKNTDGNQTTYNECNWIA